MEYFDRAEFIRLVDKSIEGKATREATFDLLEFSQKYAFKIAGGKDNKSFHYIVSTSNRSDELFHCDYTGNVWLTFGNFPELSSDIVTQFIYKLLNLNPTGFMYILPLKYNLMKGKRQGFCIEDTLVNPAIMQEFKTGILKLQNEIDPDRCTHGT